MSGGLPQPHLPYVNLPIGLVAAKGYQVVSSIYLSRMGRRLEWSIGVCWRSKLKCSEVDVGGGRYAWVVFHEVGIVPYMRYELTGSSIGRLNYRGNTLSLLRNRFFFANTYV